MRAFITGSYAYGKPKPGSDLDLVVLVDYEALDKLRTMSESKETIRFGRLNIIPCVTDLEAAVWSLGTEDLKKQKVEGKGQIAFDKEQARIRFDELREAVGIVDQHDSRD